GKHSGGLLGEILSTPFVSLFDVYVSLIFLGAIFIISILVMFDARLTLIPFFKKIWALFFKNKTELEEDAEPELDIEESDEELEEEEVEDEAEDTGGKFEKAFGIVKKE